MEQEDAIKEENVELDKVGVGEDKPQIPAKKVVIDDYKIDMVKDSQGKDIGNKLTLMVKHPDITDRNIEISGVKYEQKGKIKQSGLWVKLDNDNKLPYRSAVATMLRFLGKTQIMDLKGEQVNTVTDDGGYLQIKAY